MGDFILNTILWTLALYGLFEIIKTIINIYTYTNLKSDGIYVIIAVKNQEEKIEGFLRSFLFRVIYGKEDAINNQNFENAAKLRDKEQKEKAKLDKKRIEWEQKNQIAYTEVSENDVANVLDITVDEINDEGIVVYHLVVAEDDKGRVIGKQGRIAKAIRTVMRSAATRNNEKVSVEID